MRSTRQWRTQVPNPAWIVTEVLRAFRPRWRRSQGRSRLPERRRVARTPGAEPTSALCVLLSVLASPWPVPLVTGTCFPDSVR